MKKFQLAVACFILLISFTSCKHHDLDISVKETDKTYRFSADFDKKHTEKVREYLKEKILHPNGVFMKTEHDWDETVIMNDKTKLDLDFSPGELDFELDKKVNSESSLDNAREWAKELKAAILELSDHP